MGPLGAFIVGVNGFLCGGFVGIFVFLIVDGNLRSAADTPKKTQVVNVEQNAYGDRVANVSQINHTIVYDDGYINIRNISNNIIIKNNYGKTIHIAYVTSDVFTIMNSEPCDILLSHSTINTLVLDNVTLHS